MQPLFTSFLEFRAKRQGSYLNPNSIQIPQKNSKRYITSLPNLWSKNFLRANLSILPCATARRDSSFLISTETSTDYDVGAQLPSITDGRLLISPDFANALGRPSESGSVVGKISIRASMHPVDIQTLVNGEVRSAVMSPLHGAGAPPSVGTVPGPISPSEIFPPWSKVEVMEPILVTTH